MDTIVPNILRNFWNDSNLETLHGFIGCKITKIDKSKYGWIYSYSVYIRNDEIRLLIEKCGTLMLNDGCFFLTNWFTNYLKSTNLGNKFTETPGKTDPLVHFEFRRRTK